MMSSIASQNSALHPHTGPSQPSSTHPHTGPSQPSSKIAKIADLALQIFLLTLVGGGAIWALVKLTSLAFTYPIAAGVIVGIPITFIVLIGLAATGVPRGVRA